MRIGTGLSMVGLGSLLLCAAGCSSEEKSTATSDASVVGAGGAKACGGNADAGEFTTTLIEPTAPDGGARTAIVHVPPSYDSNKPTMLVLNLHGLLEPAGLQESVSHMSKTADERGFIVVYPQGIKTGLGVSWNAGGCCGNTQDDMGFIRDLVKKLENDYCIDPKRVYATGLSNGAMMSYRLGCEAADVFAAVAPVAGAVEVDPCSPSRPVPVLAIHGTGDTIVPFNGGKDGIVHILTFPPVSYSIDLWKHLDGCPNSPAVDSSAMQPDSGESTFDGGPSPGLFAGATLVSSKGDASCHSWSGCQDGSEVELCTVVGGGHSWPGGPPLVGKSSTDIDATTTVIDFFEKHPMP